MNFRNRNAINIYAVILTVAISCNFNKTINPYRQHHEKEHCTYNFYIAEIEPDYFAYIINGIDVAAD
jgi:hypothetical protein